MKKTFSTRERLLKSRAAKRRHNLKTAPQTFGRVTTLEEKNKPVQTTGSVKPGKMYPPRYNMPIRKVRKHMMVKGWMNDSN